jgi:thiamine-monophosphate kinase
VTVTGEVAPGRAVLRSGARPGDVLVVTGDLGASAAGLRLSRERSIANDEERALIHRSLRPTARVGEGASLARAGATAMIDLSDGLSLDLARLCRASRVGAAIELDAVPVAHGATLPEALGGGEDYELLATLPTAAAVDEVGHELEDGFAVALTAIGTIVEGAGVMATGADGTPRPLEATGWDHFA